MIDSVVGIRVIDEEVGGSAVNVTIGADVVVGDVVAVIATDRIIIDNIDDVVSIGGGLLATSLPSIGLLSTIAATGLVRVGLSIAELSTM